MDPRRISAAPQLTTGPTQAGYQRGSHARGLDDRRRRRLEPSGPRPLRGRGHPLARGRASIAAPRMGEVGPQGHVPDRPRGRQHDPDRDGHPVPGVRRDLRGALPQHPARGPRHAAALGHRASGTVHDDADAPAHLGRGGIRRLRRASDRQDGPDVRESRRQRDPRHQHRLQATIIGVPGPGPFEYKFEERPQGGAWTTRAGVGTQRQPGLVDQRRIPRGRTR